MLSGLVLIHVKEVDEMNETIDLLTLVCIIFPARACGQNRQASSAWPVKSKKWHQLKWHQNEHNLSPNMPPEHHRVPKKWESCNLLISYGNSWLLYVHFYQYRSKSHSQRLCVCKGRAEKFFGCTHMWAVSDPWCESEGRQTAHQCNVCKVYANGVCFSFSQILWSLSLCAL